VAERDRQEKAYLLCWQINYCSMNLQKPVTVEMIFPTKAQVAKVKREQRQAIKETRDWMVMMQRYGKF